MRHITLFVMIMTSTFSAAAEKGVAYWHAVPAKDKAPAFQYHLEGRGSILHVDFQLPLGLDPNRWGIHVWVADPAVVNDRVKSIRNLLTSKGKVQSLLKDSDHQGKACQQDLNEIISRFQHELELFRDYDPFYQVVLRLPGSSGQAGSMRTETVKAAIKTGEYSSEFDLNQHLDLSRSAVLHRLSVAFALEPVSTIRPAPIRNPAIVTLKQGLRMPVAKEIREDAAMLEEESILLRPSSTGSYHLWRYGDSGGVGCSGAEGMIRGPGFWIDPVKHRPLHALFRPEPREGIQLRFFRGALVVQRGDKTESLPLNLSSEGGADFKLLDLQKTDNGYVLLMQIEGFSRPDGGGSYCGGGVEGDLVWVLLNLDLKLQKQSSVLMDSCFESAESNERQIDYDSGLWSWEIENYDKHIVLHVQYDPKNPLKGMVIRSTPLKLNEK